MKRATILFPEPRSAVGSEFHARRTRDRDNDDVAPGGQRFFRRHHRCNGIPSVGSCAKRAIFLFPEPRSAVGSEFHVRRIETDDGTSEATMTLPPGGNGFPKATPLQRYPVGRIVCQTRYIPVSRATFGCWVRISRETYRADDGTSEATLGTTWATGERLFFLRKTNRIPYAQAGGPLLPTIPEGFSPPWDPCPSVCEGGVHCFETVPWQRFSAVTTVFVAMASFSAVQHTVLAQFSWRMASFCPGPVCTFFLPDQRFWANHVARPWFCPVFHGERAVCSPTLPDGRLHVFCPCLRVARFSGPISDSGRITCLAHGFARFSMANGQFAPRRPSSRFLPVPPRCTFFLPNQRFWANHVARTWFCPVLHGEPAVFVRVSFLPGSLLFSISSDKVPRSHGIAHGWVMFPCRHATFPRISMRDPAATFNPCLYCFESMRVLIFDTKSYFGGVNVLSQFDTLCHGLGHEITHGSAVCLARHVGWALGT